MSPKVSLGAEVDRDIHNRVEVLGNGVNRGSGHEKLNSTSRGFHSRAFYAHVRLVSLEVLDVLYRRGKIKGVVVEFDGIAASPPTGRVGFNAGDCRGSDCDEISNRQRPYLRWNQRKETDQR